MSFEVVPVVVNIKTLKRRLIECTQVRDRVVRGRGEGPGTRKRELQVTDLQSSIRKKRVAGLIS